MISVFDVDLDIYQMIDFYSDVNDKPLFWLFSNPILPYYIFNLRFILANEG